MDELQATRRSRFVWVGEEEAGAVGVQKTWCDCARLRQRRVLGTFKVVTAAGCG